MGLNIEDYHWSLWSLAWGSLDGIGGGYRKECEFYTPPRTGERSDSEGGYRPPSEEDWHLVYMIGKGVEALTFADPIRARQLINFFGAYPGAPDSRKDRIQKMRINPREAYHVVDRHKSWVEGWVHGEHAAKSVKSVA